MTDQMRIRCNLTAYDQYARPSYSDAFSSDCVISDMGYLSADPDTVQISSIVVTGVSGSYYVSEISYNTDSTATVRLRKGKKPVRPEPELVVIPEQLSVRRSPDDHPIAGFDWYQVDETEVDFDKLIAPATFGVSCNASYYKISPYFCSYLMGKDLPVSEDKIWKTIISVFYRLDGLSCRDETLSVEITSNQAFFVRTQRADDWNCWCLSVVNQLDPLFTIYHESDAGTWEADTDSLNTITVYPNKFENSIWMNSPVYELKNLAKGIWECSGEQVFPRISSGIENINLRIAEVEPHLGNKPEPHISVETTVEWDYERFPELDEKLERPLHAKNYKDTLTDTLSNFIDTEGSYTVTHTFRNKYIVYSRPTRGSNLAETFDFKRVEYTVLPYLKLFFKRANSKNGIIYSTIYNIYKDDIISRKYHLDKTDNLLYCAICHSNRSDTVGISRNELSNETISIQEYNNYILNLPKNVIFILMTCYAGRIISKAKFPQDIPLSRIIPNTLRNRIMYFSDVHSSTVHARMTSFVFNYFYEHNDTYKDGCDNLNFEMFNLRKNVYNEMSNYIKRTEALFTELYCTETDKIFHQYKDEIEFKYGRDSFISDTNPICCKIFQDIFMFDSRPAATISDWPIRLRRHFYKLRNYFGNQFEPADELITSFRRAKKLFEDFEYALPQDWYLIYPKNVVEEVVSSYQMKGFLANLIPSLMDFYEYKKKTTQQSRQTIVTEYARLYYHIVINSFWLNYNCRYHWQQSGFYKKSILNKFIGDPIWVIDSPFMYYEANEKFLEQKPLEFEY